MRHRRRKQPAGDHENMGHELSKHMRQIDTVSKQIGQSSYRIANISGGISNVNRSEQSRSSEVGHRRATGQRRPVASSDRGAVRSFGPKRIQGSHYPHHQRRPVPSHRKNARDVGALYRGIRDANPRWTWTARSSATRKSAANTITASNSPSTRRRSTRGLQSCLRLFQPCRNLRDLSGSGCEPAPRWLACWRSTRQWPRIGMWGRNGR